jgi:hypothetical protein
MLQYRRLPGSQDETAVPHVILADEVFARGNAALLDQPTERREFLRIQPGKDRTTAQTIQPLRLQGYPKGVMAHHLPFKQDLAKPFMAPVGSQLLLPY